MDTLLKDSKNYVIIACFFEGCMHQHASHIEVVKYSKN